VKRHAPALCKCPPRASLSYHTLTNHAHTGGVHSRDTWNDVIARLDKQAKKSKKEKERMMKERDDASGPCAAEVGENLPFPAAPRPLGCLPQEIVLEVFGCAGINRLLEVQLRPRVPTVGVAFAKPGSWKQVLKFSMKETEISRLTVIKKLEPMMAYTFRTRAGVRTEDLGEEWKGEAGRMVPEIFGPWSDESIIAKTVELTDKEAIRRLKMEKREEAKQKATVDRAARKAKKEERAARKKEKKRAGKKDAVSKKSKKERKESSKKSKKGSREKKRKREAYESSGSDSDSDSNSSSSSS